MVCFSNNFDLDDLDDGLGYDYISQIYAIRVLLSSNDHADTQLQAQIKRADQIARNTSGDANDLAVEAYIELAHNSIYQAAAHSMAAVATLAPLIESIFKTTCQCLGRELPNKGSKGNFASRIMKFVDDDSIGLKPYMPSDLKSTLEALFTYRNAMFHNSFEWPPTERERFAKQLSQWPDGWFNAATLDDEPWIFYMSSEFVDHCLDVVEKVLRGLKRFQFESNGREIWEYSYNV